MYFVKRCNLVHYAEYRYAEGRYGEGRYAEGRYAEDHGSLLLHKFTWTHPHFYLGYYNHNVVS
jgi:hypothetical protein